jgi:hypothetical protein
MSERQMTSQWPSTGPTTGGTGGSGFTCYRCGNFVPSGITHHCPSTAVALPPISNAPQPMLRGWECPVCHIGQAPWVASCLTCRRKSGESSPKPSPGGSA